jgi:adenylate cyclase
MFREDRYLAERVAQALARVVGDRSDPKTRQLLTALAALYAGPDFYYLNFYGPPGTITTLPYEDVLRASPSEVAPKGRLAHHSVFVGYADHEDPDQPDHHYSSFTSKEGVDLSGVEIMATAYANLLNQQALRPAGPVTTALCVSAFGLVAGTLAYLLRATAAVPSVLAFTALYAALVRWGFNEANLWLPLATPALVQLPVALLIGLMGQYALERRKEKRVTRALCHYLPEDLVRDLTEQQIDPTTVNRVRFGTCLATDMSGFTALAESRSPQQLALFLNEYFEALAQALKRHGVDVMEFRADMIMCAWIAPVPSSVTCRRGLDAAIEVSEIIGRFGKEHGSLRLDARVGLQSGQVYVGHTGGGGHFVYSIQGDAANTAARLESLNKLLGTRVLAAESVVQHPDGLLLRPLGLFRLSGKSNPTSVVEVLGRKESANVDQLDLCSQFAEGLAVFERKEWSHAASLFEAITKRFGDDGPSRFYLSCSQRYAAEALNGPGPSVMGEI